VALLPSRYAGSGGEGDGALQLSRKTEWIEIGPEQYRGLGQRILTTSDPELGLLEVREVVLHAAPAAP
jgi:type VI secretion system protein ImpE